MKPIVTFYLEAGSQSEIKVKTRIAEFTEKLPKELVEECWVFVFPTTGFSRMEVHNPTKT